MDGRSFGDTPPGCHITCCGNIGGDAFDLTYRNPRINARLGNWDIAMNAAVIQIHKECQIAGWCPVFPVGGLLTLVTRECSHVLDVHQCCIAVTLNVLTTDVNFPDRFFLSNNAAGCGSSD